MNRMHMHTIYLWADQVQNRKPSRKRVFQSTKTGDNIGVGGEENNIHDRRRVRKGEKYVGKNTQSTAEESCRANKTLHPLEWQKEALNKSNL